MLQVPCERLFSFPSESLLGCHPGEETSETIGGKAGNIAWFGAIAILTKKTVTNCNGNWNLI